MYQKRFASKYVIAFHREQITRVFNKFHLDRCARSAGDYSLSIYHQRTNDEMPCSKANDKDIRIYDIIILESTVKTSHSRTPIDRCVNSKIINTIKFGDYIFCYFFLLDTYRCATYESTNITLSTKARTGNV